MERTPEEQKKDWDLVEEVANAKDSDAVPEGYPSTVIRALCRVAADMRTTPRIVHRDEL